MKWVTAVLLIKVYAMQYVFGLNEKDYFSAIGFFIAAFMFVRVEMRSYFPAPTKEEFLIFVKEAAQCQGPTGFHVLHIWLCLAVFVWLETCYTMSFSLPFLLIQLLPMWYLNFVEDIRKKTKYEYDALYFAPNSQTFVLRYELLLMF